MGFRFRAWGCVTLRVVCGCKRRRTEPKILTLGFPGNERLTTAPQPLSFLRKPPRPRILARIFRARAADAQEKKGALGFRWERPYTVNPAAQPLKNPSARHRRAAGRARILAWHVAAHRTGRHGDAHGTTGDAANDVASPRLATTTTIISVGGRDYPTVAPLPINFA